MSDVIHWEYRIELIGSVFRGPKPEEVEGYLNQVGEEGWDVVNLHHPHNSNKVWITMKRQLTTRTRRYRSLPGEQW